MVMKKKLQLFSLICCLLLLTSCQKESNDNMVNSIGRGVTIDDPEPRYPDYTEINSFNIETELCDSVTTKSDKISVNITGSNTPDNMIYYFTFMALEREYNSEWIRIPVIDNMAQHIIGDPDYFWSFCCREDGTSQMWTTSTLYISDLAESLQTGSYRTVIFFPDRTVYTYFEIIE